MPTPIVTPLPALDRTSPDFRTNVDLYFGSQIPTFTTQINTLADDLTAKSAAATAAAALATESIATVTAAVTTTAASASAASASATAASGSASAASASATTAGTKAAEAETARAASVVAKNASEAAAATSLSLRDQTQGLRDQTEVLRDETQAIAAGDINGTGPDQYRNNAENDIRFVPNAYTPISSAVDWDTLTSSQRFSTSTGGVNSPGNYHWSVEVERTNDTPLNVTQTATTRVLGDTQVWRRQYQGSSWTAWARQANVLRIVEISTGTAAAAGYHYLLLSSLVLAMPSVPAIGDRVGFTNLSGTETASINPGFAKIRGTTGVMTLDSITASAVLTYSGSAQGWV